MRSKYSIILIGALVLSLTAFSIMNACAPKAPAKEKVIKVGLMMELTGPGSAINARGQSVAHYLAYWRWVNDNGGIRGIRVEPIWDDNGGNNDRAIANFKKYKDAGALATTTVMTVQGESLQPLATRDQLPLIVPSTSDALQNPQHWTYTFTPSYTETFAGILKWVKENWKGSGRPRIAQISEEIPMGKAHIEPGKKMAADLGIDFGPIEFGAYTNLDFTPQLLRIRDSGANYVYLPSRPPQHAQILRDAVKLGIADKVEWIIGPQVTHWEMMPFMPEQADNKIAISYFAWPEEEYSGRQKVIDILSKYVAPDPQLGRPTFGTGFWLYWGNYVIMNDAIGRAIDKVGYDKLDGKAVKDAIESTKNLDMFGATPPLNFSPTQHTGESFQRFVRIDYKGKTVKPISDWFRGEAPK